MDVNAQEIKFKHLSVEDGLSQSVVNCMLQDRTGFLWFGTQDGLNRFDGYQFKVFRNDSKDANSISSNNIWSIFEDKSGNIWVGTQEGVLNCFDPQTEKFKHYILDSSKIISGNSVSCIYQDRAGKLWIGFYKSGLYQLDIISDAVKQWQHQSDNPNSLSNNYVTSIFEDLQGNLWIGTYYGLCLLTKESPQGNFIRYFHDPANPNTLSNNTIWTFFQSRNDPDHLWVGTFNGLTNIEINKKVFSQVIPDQNNPDPFSRSVSSICEIRSGNESANGGFWIGTYGGLLKFDTKNMKFKRWISEHDNLSSLSYNLINKVLIDRSGVLWIATQKGINYYSPRKDKFGFQSQQKYEGIDLGEFSGLDVQTICETSDLSDGKAGETVWFGTSSGLFYLNKNDKNYEVIRSKKFSDQNIWSLAKSNSNGLWVGTYGDGLVHLDIKSNKIRRWTGGLNDPKNISNAYVKAIHHAKSGSLWIGLWGGGLNRINLKTGQVTKWRNSINDPQSLSYNDVWVIFEDSKERIWIGTFGGGLNLFDSAGGSIFYRWIHDSKDEKTLCNNNVFSVFESIYKKKISDNRTILWIGTANGLDKFIIHNSEFLNDGKVKVEIEHFLSQKDLPFNTINSIVEDMHGHLWLTTNNGLLEFDPGTARILNTYTMLDGLLSKEFTPNSALKTASGEIFIGSINGLNVYYPDNIIHSNYTPPVVLTDFQLFNQPVPVSPESPLKTSINTAKEITLSYDQNVFSFQFTSLDYNATEMNQYAYMMEGFDKEWIYCGTRRFVTYTHLDPGRYTFRVKATNSDGIWNEAGTQIAIIIDPPYWATWWFRGLVLLTIVGIIYSFYRMKLNRLLELERLRLKIASDLHDDIGSALTRISLESELLKSNVEIKDRDKTLQRIGTLSREIITSMSDVVWSIDSRNDSIESLINRMKDFSFSLFSLKNRRVIFETSNLSLQKKLKVDIRQNVYLIFKEAINNAAKYSDSDQIKVSMKNENGKFVMVIHDPGTTYSHQKLTGHGFRNMLMRAERLGGKIEFIKEDGLKVIFKGNEL